MTALSTSPKPTEAVALFSALVKLILALLEVDRKAEAAADFAAAVADVWAGAKEGEHSAISASVPAENSAGTTAATKAESPGIEAPFSLVSALRLFGITSFEISPEMLVALLKREGKQGLLREIALLHPGEVLSLSALVRGNIPNVLNDATVSLSAGRLITNFPKASRVEEIDIESRDPFTLSDLSWCGAASVRLTCEFKDARGTQPFLLYGIRLTSSLAATVRVVRMTLNATNGLKHSQLLIWESL